LSRKTGRLLKGGEPDVNSVAKVILNDFQRGKLPYFVKPPNMVRVEDPSDHIPALLGRVN
jgi:nuclear GTP-binding protein